ncbi:MAG: hypothetical protein WAO98_08295 [Alphaproteobacteria bacterium]
MSLSKESTAAVCDLIENKLAIMTIDDRDDVREMVALKRALAELSGHTVSTGLLPGYNTVPRRGRRRKVSDMIEERA